MKTVVEITNAYECCGWSTGVTLANERKAYIDEIRTYKVCVTLFDWFDFLFLKMCNWKSNIQLQEINV